MFAISNSVVSFDKYNQQTHLLVLYLEQDVYDSWIINLAYEIRRPDGKIKREAIVAEDYSGSFSKTIETLFVKLIGYITDDYADRTLLGQQKSKHVEALEKQLLTKLYATL